MQLVQSKPDLLIQRILMKFILQIWCMFLNLFGVVWAMPGNLKNKMASWWEECQRSWRRDGRISHYEYFGQSRCTEMIGVSRIIFYSYLLSSLSVFRTCYFGIEGSTRRNRILAGILGLLSHVKSMIPQIHFFNYLVPTSVNPIYYN